ncbi:centriolin [Alosa sapidissima]|uniref:centriolin n=1 Tax=Alosa sapidissima TaxID=34773 RepID=UPI001C09C322|nr:centriolin [Alosa sapidissima]
MKTSKLPVKLSPGRTGSLPPARMLGSPSVPNLTGKNDHLLHNKTLSDDENHLPDDGRLVGVRYITEDLIRRVTKQDDLSSVQTLNLCGTKSDKNIKYIENLERCERLQVLNLSYNIIQKMEKLDRLHRLKELDLSHNTIRKLEGLQHMGSLQLLNLSYNLIESVPLWLPKRLRSLTTLNLQDNSISSLHELCRLKPLLSLSELRVCGNPLSLLPHHRPLLIYHLRALQLLDTQAVSQHDRDQAHQRFHMEEVARLEQELEQRNVEVQNLQREREAAVAQLHQQEELYHSLQRRSQQQQQQHSELQTEVDTKSELLRQKTGELTRACQKHYELEQELAFLKIDAKFEPLPYVPGQDAGPGSGPSESPYIGKARHQRRPVARAEPDADDQPGPASRVASVSWISPGDVSDKAEESREEERLQLLQVEIKRLEQQIVSANQELRGLEETATQKRVCEAERERIRQHLMVKLQELRQDQAEAQSLETQLDTHAAHMGRAQTQLDLLTDQLQSLEPSEPKHDHLKAQVSRQKQLLDIMSQRHAELEARLDYMITRIAQETQDIQDLEQQLTDGQILANESLKRELEDVISGLQEYLRGVRGQARQAQSDCRRLQSQNQALERLLQDREEQCRQLQHGQEEERSTETEKLRAELSRLRSLTKVERAALEAELQNERQARENAEVRTQLETENLLEHISSLKEESDALRDDAAELQTKLQSTSAVFIHPDDLLQRLQSLTQNLSTDTPDASVGATLQNVAVEERLQELQQEVWRLVRQEREQREESKRLQEEREESKRLRDEWEEARRQQETLSGELQLLRQQLTSVQKQNQQQTWEAAKKKSEHETELRKLREELQGDQEVELQRLREELEAAREAELQQLKEELRERQEAELNRLRKKLQKAQEAELQGLREELQEAQEQQYLMSQRLQEAESEREGLLVELHQQDTQALEELKKSVSSADRRAGQQLAAVTQQLQTLYRTALHIRQQREQDAEQLEDSRQHMAEVGQDLERAETETAFLQRVLKDGQCVLDSKSAGSPESSHQQEDLEQLTRAVKRLTEQLSQASRDKSLSVEELLDEMVSLRDTLKQSSYVSNLQDSHRSGHWYFIHTGQSAASVASQGTQDSGLGSQLPSSPQRRPRPQHPPHERNRPKGAGYWLYSPHPPNRVGSDSGGERDMESSAPWWFFPAGALLYTSLPTQPPPPSSQCHLPKHQHMERELHEAQNNLKEQKRLEQERKDQQRETHQLRRDHKHLRARLRSEAEKSVCEEVECLEETLQRRRAELREADRLLLHAHTQSKDAKRRCGETQRRVCELQQDLEEMETRAQDYAKQLIHSKNKLSAEQEELQRLQNQRQNEKQSLAATNTHYKQLRQRLEDNERLLEETEDRLSQRKRELQSLDNELCALDRRVGQWREEERVLQTSLQQHRDTLLQELTHGEEETQGLHTRIKELRVCVETLSQQKRDVEKEVCEGRSHLTLIRQEQQREEETLNKLLSELKCVQEQKVEHVAQCEQLQQKCRHLEARQRHAQRCVSNAEEVVCETKAKLTRLDSELKQSRETEGVSEELERLREKLHAERIQLDAVKEAIRSVSSKRDDLVEEQLRLRGDVQASAERAQKGQRRLEVLEQQLTALDSQLTHKHAQLQRHHESLQQQQQEWAEADALQQQRRQQLQAQLQTLEGAVAERVQRMEQLTAEEAELQDWRRALHTEEEQHRRKGQELCEWEVRLQQQQQELEAQRGQLEGWRCKVQRLQKLLTKQTHNLQEAQQAAKQSERRAHKLQTEVHTLSQELQCVREKLFAQEEKTHVCESSSVDAGAEPRAGTPMQEPEPEFPAEPSSRDHQSPSPSLSPSPPSTEHEQLKALFTPSRTAALTAQDEQWRGELLREKLEQHEDELKAQLRRRMFDQQEALCVRRQQAEGSLDGLRRRVDWLDQLLDSEGSLEDNTAALKPHRQHEVRLSSSWCSESADPSGRPVRLDPLLPERDRTSELQHTSKATCR